MKSGKPGPLSACADNWAERGRLEAFVAEIKKRVDAEGDAEVGGRPLSEWVAWAVARIAALDPFRAGVGDLFESILR